jgi:hypothetical protein
LKWPLAGFFAILFAILIWVSYCNIFILLSIVTVLLIQSWVGSDKKKACFALFMGILWFLSFGVLYSETLARFANHNSLKQIWQSAFLPYPFTFGSFFIWTYYSFLNVFKDLMGLGFPQLQMIVGLIGGISLFRRESNKALVCIFPIVLFFLPLV